MLSNKSSNNMMHDQNGSSSGGPQPLLSTTVQPPSNNSYNSNKQRRNKMDSNTSKPPHKSGSGNHQGHHQSHHHQHQIESKLYAMSSIEMKDPLEVTLEDSYTKLKHLVCPNEQQQKPDSVTFNELSNFSNQSKSHYDEVCNALLYSILTDPSNAQKCLRNLFLCNNLSFNMSSGNPSNVNNELNSNISQSAASLAASTSYGVLINNMHSIITENYARLQDIPRQQLVWLLKELVKARVGQCEKLMLQMLRNIQSGSLAEKNYWLAESLLEILTEPVAQSVTNGADSKALGSLWIYSNIELLTQTVYTYLRIIADHSQAVALNQLRQRETEFCIQVLRERWNDCMLIGRDLVRLLQNVAKLNEFEQLWRDLIHSPQTLSGQFAQMGGLVHLMRQPTRRRCLISRLTIDMERKIYFIITSVKNGQQKRYLEWFQRQYLNTPESQSLRVDLMRYICVVVHPTNEQLNSGLTPRWALCGWLINSCTNQIESANLKLALYFDWLMYDAKKDNIMLIEPAILLMFNSIRPNSGLGPSAVSLANQLFDFLCRISTNYHWPLKDQILNGIMQSFKDVIEKRVIPSIQTFFTENPNSKFQQGSFLDRDLKNLIQATFGTFFQTLGMPAGQQQPITPTPSVQPAAPQPLMTASPKPSLAALNSDNTANSSFSSFKRQLKTEPSSDESPQAASNYLSNVESNESPSFKSYFSSLKNSEHTMSEEKSSPVVKVEPQNSESMFKLDTGAQFSDDQDSDSNSASENKFDLNQVKSKPSTETNQLITNSTVAASSAYLQLQKQLKQFSLKPVKIFSVDEANSAYGTHQNHVENQLNLVQSDELREKLSDFNEKINESLENEEANVGSNYLHVMFKDILNALPLDPEYQNTFTLSLSDVAVSICLILRNDFTNNLLPVQFYTTGGVNNLKLSKINSPDAESGQSNGQQISLLTPNAFTIGLVNEAINQRVIFVLFKELSMTQNQSYERELYVTLLHEIFLKQNRIGYYFLFFIYVMSLKLTSDKQLNGSSTISTSSEILTLMKIYFEFTKERQNEIRAELKSKNQNQQQQSSSDEANNSDTNSAPGSESDSDFKSSDASGNSESDTSLTDDQPSIDESDLILGECYMQDLRLCQQDDPQLFCFLLPFICSQYMPANYMCNNSELVYLICSCIDSRQLKDLISSITTETIVLLKQGGNSNRKVTRMNNSANRKKAGSTRSAVPSDDDKPNIKKRKRTTSNGSAKNDDTKRNKQARKDSKKTKKTSRTQNNKKNNQKRVKTLSKKNTLFNVLESSLSWESIEQIFFWQFLLAHDDIDVNYLLPLLDKLDANQHAEAIFNLFQMLKLTEPTFDLVKFLCRRRIDENMERALFVYWTRRASSGETKLSQIFCKLLNKSASFQQSQQATTLKKINLQSFTNNKKLTAEQQLEIANQQKSARTANKSANLKYNSHNSAANFSGQVDRDQLPTLDQVLFYLNRLRLNNECINFILKENILEALHKVYKKHCDEELKRRYADLFTLADEFDVEENASDENQNDETDSDSDIESDSTQRNKKNTTRSGNSIVKSGRSKAKPGKQAGNKRVIRVPSSKLPHKKPKLRSQNSSESDKETDQKYRNDSNTDESDEADSNSDSSNENKNVKNTRKK